MSKTTAEMRAESEFQLGIKDNLSQVVIAGDTLRALLADADALAALEEQAEVGMSAEEFVNAAMQGEYDDRALTNAVRARDLIHAAKLRRERAEHEAQIAELKAALIPWVGACPVCMGRGAYSEIPFFGGGEIEDVPCSRCTPSRAALASIKTPILDEVRALIKDVLKNGPWLYTPNAGMLLFAEALCLLGGK